jgi:hypothetical protein
MSLKTWKEKFYPKKPTKRMTKVEAVEHCLLKWSGLTRTNLKAHNVDITLSGDIFGHDGIFYVDSESCALCIKYYDYYTPDDSPCNKCPLYESLDDMRCDARNESPYGQWRQDKNPKPMIKALKKTLKAVRTENMD